MNIRKTLLAAALAAVPWIGAGPAGAVAPMRQAAPQSPAANAALVAALNAQRSARGLDADHGFVVSRRHPGTGGSQVTRLDHTYKGVRIFGSDSVVVTDAGGKVVSESVSERRLGLGKGAANRLGASTADFDVRPTLASKAAIEAALKSLPPGADALTTPSAELIIYPVMNSERLSGARNKADAELNALDLQDIVDHYELSYLVHTRMAKGDRPLYHDSVVSVRDGRILAQWSVLQTAVDVGHSQ